MDLTTSKGIRKHLLEGGVKNLKEFGYSEVNVENIMTDVVYREFFKSMLEENIGIRKDIDETINQLLTEI
jgi:hypothetical protein